MDLNTPITTAARRITRRVNDAPREVALAFDLEGNVVDSHPSDMWYANPAEAPVSAVRINGMWNAHDLKGRHVRLTYRVAQDHLDAYKRDRSQYPTVDDYLYWLDVERESAARA